MERVIVIDLGTTGVKAALMDRNGQILAQDYRNYPIWTDNDRVEQNPEDWWTSTVAVLSSLMGKTKDIDGVVLSGQMQDLIPLLKNGSPAPAILYSDVRAREEAAHVERLIGRDELIRITGNIQDASSLLAKIVWFRNHDQNRYDKTYRILFGAHDYIAWKLTGKEFADFTTLSTTGLLDINSNNYAYPIIDALGIRRDILPTPVRAGNKDGIVSRDAAAITGLPEGTPVFHGSGDVGSTTIGAGAGMPGSVSCYLGTSGWIASTASSGFADPETGIYNIRHPDPTRIIKVGPMLMAAGNIDWAIDAFGYSVPGENKFLIFDDEVSAVKPGRIIYLPYLAGERAPFKDPDVRGAFIGIDRSTTRGELWRATLEGVAFAMRTIYETAGGQRDDSESSKSTFFSLSGGGARSPIWPQIIADVFGREVVVQKNAEMAGIHGAFVILGKELGWFPDYCYSKEVWKVSASFVPSEENQKTYEQLYAIFVELYPALQSSYASLAGLRTKILKRGVRNE